MRNGERRLLLERVKESLTVETLLDRMFGEPMRRGAAFCPFHAHQRRTPSFHVKQNRWRCFSCGKHGDVISFYREASMLNGSDPGFVAALNACAQMCGIAPGDEASVVKSIASRPRPVRQASGADAVRPLVGLAADMQKLCRNLGGDGPDVAIWLAELFEDLTALPPGCHVSSVQARARGAVALAAKFVGVRRQPAYDWEEEKRLHSADPS